jgi:hypothetical protein
MVAGPCRSAYLWTLQLAGADLAWEYLRRNPVYVEAWRDRHKRAWEADQAGVWGLQALEDPTLDARDAQPLWERDPDTAVQLIPHSGGGRFDLWSFRGRKVLIHDGAGVAGVVAPAAATGVRFRLSTPVLEGQPFAFAITPGPRLGERFRAAEWFQQRAAGGEPKASQPSKTALDHMRRLMALDAMAAGLRQRQIAGLVFGPAASDDWHADPRHRSNLRYLLRRAEALRDGGYRGLIGLPEPESPRKGQAEENHASRFST